MQLQIGWITSEGDTLIIRVSEGGASWPINVVRIGNGTFCCWSPQCVHAKRQFGCEHVLFARDKYESDIAPTEDRKRQEELRIATEKLEKAKAIVAQIEAGMPKQPEPDVSVLPLGGRRIFLPK